MKSSLVCLGLLALGSTCSPAQSRLSVAPTYWFSYSPYSYQVNLTFNGSTTHTPTSGHGNISSFGLTARYHFTPKWDVSAGLLYYRNSDHLRSPQGPYGESTPFTSTGWQLPVLVNYRLTGHRLSPYFSAGTLLARSNTFTGRPVTADGVIGVGLSYRFKPGLSLLLQPTASYSFYRPAGDAFYTFTQYSSYGFGLHTQLIWHF